ncbi:MAG: hypothetical protein E7328_07480 [Clostridiales bacterium]|nr:hypothetical protein [Clostridiales bacterium]
MKNPKIDAYIGFAARSRNCLGGFTGVEGAIKSKKAKLVIGDVLLKENTREKLQRMCQMHGVPIIYLEEPGSAAGKHNNLCLAILDHGLAQAIRKAYEAQGVKHDGKDR